MKKLVVRIFLCVALVACAGAWFYFTDRETVVYDREDYSVSVTTPSVIKVKFSGERIREMENTVDVIREFDVTFLGTAAGRYSITERTLGNGTVFLFDRLENEGRFAYEVETAFVLPDDADVTDTSWNPQIVEHPYHDVFGQDPTVNPFGRVTVSNGDGALELIVGNVYVSKPLVKTYERGKVSKVRELAKEFREVDMKGNRISQSAKVGTGDIAESWTMIAQAPLFTSADEENAYVDFALHNQTTQLNWLTMDGPFTKLPFSIDPGTKMGYGRVIGRIEDDVALEWYGKSQSLFFESMVLNSRINLLYYIEEFEGTRWPSEYTSTWLSNAYGVRAPYVDTRYNEYVSLFLDKTARQFPEGVTDARLYVPVYADYLLSRVEAGEMIEAGDGYLIVDYFDEDPETALTHASLNHELGGLKILLTAYQDTGDEKYLTTARDVIAGIEAFGQADGGWVRENGDLWYQARPDGTFSGDDYPQLTLLDLLETQKLLEELQLGRNVYFDQMIEAKLGYLTSEGIELIEKVRVLMDK
ncbi:hypothetical protein [Sporosarcina sp. NPDC096371]|uniref:hypothetical protein n=1 Tax=Sporosarcina sp. NPDC096371 TaxID=3364530 RepID=UPI0037F743B4